MRTVFVVNPKSGKKEGRSEFIKKIRETSEKTGIVCEVYVTKGVMDAERYVKEYIKERQGEKIRFISCGGDGTLNEVVNGAYRSSNVSVGVIPMGTGNDFVRNFGEIEDFLNIENIITGFEVDCDLIKYSGMIDDKLQNRVCVNMINIGFDCNVCDTTNKLKKKPFMSGSLAYLLAVFITLIKKKSIHLKIKSDDNIIANGEVLLTAIANGTTCGGGIKNAPLAKNNDGLMDINVISNLSRFKFIKFFSSYKDGSYINNPSLKKIVRFEKCKEISITPLCGIMPMGVDGEIYNAKKMDFQILRNAVKILLPCTLKENKRELAGKMQ